MAKGGGQDFKRENTAPNTKNRSRQQVLAAGLKTRGDKGGGAPLTATPAGGTSARSRTYMPGMGGTRVFRGGNS